MFLNLFQPTLAVVDWFNHQLDMLNLFIGGHHQVLRLWPMDLLHCTGIVCPIESLSERRKGWKGSTPKGSSGKFPKVSGKSWEI